MLQNRRVSTTLYQQRPASTTSRPSPARLPASKVITKIGGAGQQETQQCTLARVDTECPVAVGRGRAPVKKAAALSAVAARGVGGMADSGSRSGRGGARGCKAVKAPVAKGVGVCKGKGRAWAKKVKEAREDSGSGREGRQV